MQGMVTIKKTSLGANWLKAAEAHPVFCSMKRLRVFPPPPGLDARPSQATTLKFVRFPQQIAVTHL